MPESARREHTTNKTPLMTVGQYSSQDYCPFKASSIQMQPQYLDLAAQLYLAAYQQGFRVILLITVNDLSNNLLFKMLTVRPFLLIAVLKGMT